MFGVSLFLLVFIFFGLVIISKNMERITLRNEQDFLFFAAKEEGLWEIRFLGSSLEISQEAIREQLRGYWQEWLGGGKNRQEDRYPIK